MKIINKIIILFAVVLLQCQLLHGQTSISTALIEQSDCSFVGGLIRSWKGSKAVAYHTRNGEQLFSIIDSASWTVYSAKVPSIYTIRDFRIVGDTLYCGGASHDTAMLAFFNINEITGSPYINFQVFKIEGLFLVSRLAAFRNSAKHGVGIAAIGKETQYVAPYDLTGTYMIWCDNYNGAPFTVSTKKCDINWGLTQSSEYLTDVIITRKYVAFVGYYINSSNGILCIRKGDRNGPFLSTLIDTVHRYGTLGETLESIPIAEPLNSDTIALAYGCEDISGEHAAHLHLFDLSDMTMYNTHRILLATDYKISVNEMVYMPKHKTLLMEVESDAGYQVLYAVPSAMGAYLVATLAPSTGEVICDIDYHNSDYYILSTHKHWMLQKMGSSSSPNTCITKSLRNALIWTVSLDAPKFHSEVFPSGIFSSRRLFPTSFNTTLFCVHF